MDEAERSTDADDYIDTETALEAFKALRVHGVGVLPASILAAGIVIAEAVTDRS